MSDESTPTKPSSSSIWGGGPAVPAYGTTPKPFAALILWGLVLQIVGAVVTSMSYATAMSRTSIYGGGSVGPEFYLFGIAALVGLVLLLVGLARLLGRLERSLNP